MKCPGCGEKVVKCPIKDKEGNIIWKNLLIGDPMYIWIFISVMAIVIGVNMFMEDCNYIKDKPYEFCDQWCEVRGEYMVSQDKEGVYKYEFDNDTKFNFTID